MTNDCCEKCYGRIGTSGGGGVYCINPSCPCHSKQESHTPSNDHEHAVARAAKKSTEDMTKLVSKHGDPLAAYYTRDHSHCFESENPPCGQRIQHLKCCLCEMGNPIIASEIAKAQDEGWNQHEKEWKNELQEERIKAQVEVLDEVAAEIDRRTMPDCTCGEHKCCELTSRAAVAIIRARIKDV